MTVLTTTAKAGPYAGAGTAGPFPVPFRFLEASHLRVIRTAAGVDADLVITTDYTVSGVGNPSGSVTLTAALPVGQSLTILRDVPATQEADYVAGDAFPAESHEVALDKLTMIAQQLAEEVGRAVKVGPTSSTDPDALLASIAASEAAAAASAVAAAASLDSFDDRYLGAFAADPTTDNDGQALIVGALYWNTASNVLRVWNGLVWQTSASPAPITVNQQTFNGTGSQTAFTLSSAPATPQSVEAFISGVRQVFTTHYSVAGTTLTFVAAPPSGTANVYVRWLSSVAVGVPDDLSVSTAKLADDAVTFAKLQNIATARLLGRATAGTGDVEELTTLPAVNGAALTNLNGANISSGDIAAARITNALNASGSAPLFACRAWVNFNGTGTVAIRASGNVSSITDNGTGDYTVNFTTAMVDANYGFIANGSSPSVTNLYSVSPLTSLPSTSAFRFGTAASSGGAFTDASYASVAIFR